MRVNAPAPPHLMRGTPAAMLPADAFFWYAEAATPQLRPLVAGLFMLDRAPKPARMRAAFDALVHAVPRLRQRVVEPRFGIGFPRWEDDAGFDLDYHLRSIVLPPAAASERLYEFCATAFATPLDHLRPLWEAYVIEGLETGRAACFLKVHHSVMDGVGAMVVLDTFTQARRDSRPAAVTLRGIQQSPAVAAANANGLAAVWRTLTDMIGAGISAGLGALRDPVTAADGLRRATQTLSGIVADLGTPADLDPFSRRCTGVGRRLAALDVPLARMRAIKQTLGGTLNDVVLAAVTGALRAYHRRHNVRLDHASCIVPTNLRAASDRSLGNRVGAFSVRLPLHERDPLVRLARIREQTGAAKGSHQAVAYQGLMQLVAVVPAVTYRALTSMATGRVHAICSNVPGPPAERYLAGATVEAIYPFAPVLLGTVVSIALLSYGERYCIGIDTDPAAIPDPETLRDDLQRAIDELAACAQQLQTRASGTLAPPRRAARARSLKAAAGA